MAYWFGVLFCLVSVLLEVLCWNMCLPVGFWKPYSWHFCYQILRFWFPRVSFGMLGASTLASWGTLGRSWNIGERKRGHFEVQALNFIDFVMILRNLCWQIFHYFWQKMFFSYLFTGCFFWWCFGLNLGVWDWETKHSARDVLQKPAFPKIRFSCFQGPFFMILGSLGTNFYEFCRPGDWLEI